jgi:soluble lytic murein transglycosylase
VPEEIRLIYVMSIFSFSITQRFFVSAMICIAALSAPPLWAETIQQGTDKGTVALLIKEEISEKQIKDAVNALEQGLFKEAEDILMPALTADVSSNNKVSFLMGRIYKEQKEFDKAETYLSQALEHYPLLSDYAQQMLAEVYVETERFDKAIGAAKRIRNSILRQDSARIEIEALLETGRHDEAVKYVFSYVKKYPSDWEYQLYMAENFQQKGDMETAVKLYKNIYINAADVDEDVYSRLKALKADTLTGAERLSRAENLFDNKEYGMAEHAFRSLLKNVKGDERSRVLYKYAMSQFRQKKYSESSKNFGRLGSPKSMYWRAKSYYRTDKRGGFVRTKEEFESKYPGNRRLALIYLMEADEFRRKGRIIEAEKGYKKVLSRFSKNTEEALWGLGWMHYTAGNYEKALHYFRKLSSFSKSREYYKYMYWKAKTQEKMWNSCELEKGEKDAGDICSKKDTDFFSGIPFNESYYGYLIKFRNHPGKLPEKVILSKPARLDGEVYERIEALSLLGMRDEAALEVESLLKKTRKLKEFLYVGFIAMELDQYKDVIAFAEPLDAREFLPYSYPHGFWDHVNQAARIKGLDQYLISAVIREESRFDREAVSFAGAIGLMQLMPGTADMIKRKAGVTLDGKRDLMDAGKNILLGSHFLSGLMNEFNKIPLAIAGYNAGKNAVKRWIANLSTEDLTEFIENIPYRETRKYVKRVLKSYWQYRTINGQSVERID